MRFLITLIAISIYSEFSIAQMTEKHCASLSNQQIAEFFLRFLENGADDGRPLKKNCNITNNLSTVSTQERDVYPEYIILNPQDKIFIVGKAVELVDEIGPMNEFEVNYEIIKNNKTLKGKFSFTRVSRQHAIDDLGCAYLLGEPTVPFLKKECQF